MKLLTFVTLGPIEYKIVFGKEERCF